MILGLPWLVKPNPHINWATGEVMGWGEGCQVTCLSSVSAPDITWTSAPPHALHHRPWWPGPSSPLDSDFPDLSKGPPCYLDLKDVEVFNKAWATSLPPHRTYDCAIVLLPGMVPPRGWLPVGSREREAMQEYVDNPLMAEIIWLSSLPAGNRVLLCGEEGKMSLSLHRLQRPQ